MNLPGGKATSKEGPPGPDGLSDNAALVTAASQETVSQARPPQNQTHRHCEGYYMIIAVLVICFSTTDFPQLSSLKQQ